MPRAIGAHVAGLVMSGPGICTSCPPAPKNLRQRAEAVRLVRAWRAACCQLRIENAFIGWVAIRRLAKS